MARSRARKGSDTASPKRARKEHRSTSRKRIRKDNRSESPKQIKKEHRSESPKRRKKDGRSASPKRTRKERRSATPKRPNKERRSVSPKLAKKERRSASPKRPKKDDGCTSSKRRRKGDRSASPKRRRKDEHSASPKQKRKDDQSASPKRRRKNDQSASPKRRRKNDQSASPKRKRKNDQSASPKRRRKDDRSFSPKRTRKVDRSASAKRRKKDDRSASPKLTRKDDRSVSPKRPRKDDRSASAKRTRKDKRSVSSRRQQRSPTPNRLQRSPTPNWRKRSPSLQQRQIPSPKLQPSAPADVNVRKHRKEKVQSVLGYTNADNPFNDPSLTDKFVWKKRSEFLHAAGLYDKSDKAAQLQKIDAKMAEIERVKVRRDERAIEQQMLEEQRALRERELLMESFDDWESKEESFLLEQVKKKSAIRIEQGRERPVDLMHKAMQILDGKKFDDMELLSTPPHEFIQEMHKDDLVDLRKDVRGFATADERYRDDWEAIGVLCDEALEAIAREAAGTAGVEDCGIPANIHNDVHELLANQSVHELEDTKDEVAQAQTSQDAAVVDTSFMEAVRKRIPFYIATRKVINMHEKAMRIAYGSSGAPRIKEPAQPKEDNEDAVQSTVVDEALSMSEPEENEEDLLKWEPALRPFSSMEADEEVVIIDALADENARKRIRQELLDLYSAEQDEGYALWKRERSRGFGEDEANFNAADGQVVLQPRKHDWDLKYKPRKPRFFNRVKTGFSWNKYNKAHFDYENPPPKHVCGYRFNIFYPDLIDKIKGVPKYHIEKSDSPDTVILHFTAGPPYEDIAFKIVNKEWMLNPRQGFRCVFDKGVLQLYFNVKRGWYKR